MCKRKARFRARLANAFIKKRELEGCRDELRKYECPFCGRYHVTKCALTEDRALNLNGFTLASYVKREPEPSEGSLTEDRTPNLNGFTSASYVKREAEPSEGSGEADG